MASWQARVVAHAVSGVARREHWGDVGRVARRARLLFGAPRAYGLLGTLGLRRGRVRGDGVQGEWLEPAAPRPGVVLCVHGGGFVACSAAAHRPISGALARFTGRRVFSVDYAADLITRHAA